MDFFFKTPTILNKCPGKKYILLGGAVTKIPLLGGVAFHAARSFPWQFAKMIFTDQEGSSLLQNKVETFIIKQSLSLG